MLRYDLYSQNIMKMIFDVCISVYVKYLWTINYPNHWNYILYTSFVFYIILLKILHLRRCTCVNRCFNVPHWVYLSLEITSYKLHILIRYWSFLQFVNWNDSRKWITILIWSRAKTAYNVCITWSSHILVLPGLMYTFT